MALGGMCKQVHRLRNEGSAMTKAHSRGSIVAATACVLAGCQVVSCRGKWMARASKLDDQKPFRMVLIHSAATLGLRNHWGDRERTTEKEWRGSCGPHRLRLADAGR